MRNFTFFTDTGCDLPLELVERYSLSLIPLPAISGDEVYDGIPDENCEKIRSFYTSLRGGKAFTTSAANLAELEERWRPLLEAGQDILYITFSSALSSTFQSSLLLSKELMEAYPSRKVYVVDSRSASMGQGLLVYLTAERIESGATLEEARDFAESTKMSICHRFTVDDLMHLLRGGRVNAASAVMGTVLNIKPVMHTDTEGRLVPTEKVKGRKASIKRLFTLMEETYDRSIPQTVFISHSDAEAEAQALADMVREKLGINDIRIFYIGPTIGSHTGPGTIAIFFQGSPR